MFEQLERNSKVDEICFKEETDEWISLVLVYLDWLSIHNLILWDVTINRSWFVCYTHAIKFVSLVLLIDTNFGIYIWFVINQYIMITKCTDHFKYLTYNWKMSSEILLSIIIMCDLSYLEKFCFVDVFPLVKNLTWVNSSALFHSKSRSSTF